MKLPDAAHRAQHWRIHEVTRDFRLLDVWALPVRGGPDDFPRLVQAWTSFSPERMQSVAAKGLFAIRFAVGRLLGWDDGNFEAGRSLVRDRLPAELREGPSGPDATPFSSLYLTSDEWAAELVNRTVHGVLHLGWVSQGDGTFRGQLAVLVKPAGLLGRAYLAAIEPFRHLIVYPALMREIERVWQEQAVT